MPDEKQLKLSKIREWTGLLNLSLADAAALIDAAKGNERALVILREKSTFLANILDNAPRECVEPCGWGGWSGGASLMSRHRLPYLTYRLYPDVELLDDTAEETEYEFVPCELLPKDAPRKRWRLLGDGYWGETLRSGPDLDGYICTKVEDVNEQVGYIVSWPPQRDYNGVQWAYATLRQFVGGFKPTITLDGEVTPKRVVFGRTSEKSGS